MIYLGDSEDYDSLLKEAFPTRHLIVSNKAVINIIVMVTFILEGRPM